MAALLAGGFLLAGIAVPLAALIARPGASAVLTALADLTSRPGFAATLGGTLLQATLSTILTLALGLPAALLFARYAFPGKSVLKAVLTVPFVMPTVVAGAGFLSLVGPSGLLGVNGVDTLSLLVVTHAFYNIAIVVRVVGGFLEANAATLQAAAATLGANAWRTARRVTLPLAAPTVLAAGVLVFIFSFTSFGMVLIVTPGGAWDTLEVEIYRNLSRLLRVDRAVALAVVQLAAVMLLAGVYTALQRRSAVPLAASVPPRRPRGREGWVLAALLLPPLMLTAAPLVSLAWQAFHPPGSTGVTLSGFQAAFAPSRFLGVASAGDAIFNSLRLAAASALVAVPLGLAFAVAVVRGRARLLDRASLLPLAVSAVTLGLGVLLAYPQLAGRFWGLALAHALIATPFVARTLLPSLRSLPASRLQAAATLGAGPWRRLMRVDLPALRPALAAGGGFAVAVSLGEFGAALVLTRPELATLPVAIYQRLARPGAESYAAALALALMLLLLTGLVMAAVDRLGGRGEW